MPSVPNPSPIASLSTARPSPGGVTAGIDVALTVAAEITGRATAEAIQLGIEYAPAPPFASGSPGTADPAVVAALLAWAETCQRDRAERVARAAAAL